MPEIIAEIGCNHRGDIDTAIHMIETAAFCGCNRVKFQKRSIRDCLTPEQYNAQHEKPENSYGETYGKHREFLEFDIQHHEILKSFCEEMGVEYGSSVWDVRSAEEIVSLSPSYIKIPSACNNHIALIDYLCDEYVGEIHVSLGMTTYTEEAELVDFFDKKNRLSDLVLYACTSGYPVDIDDICLMEIKRIIDKYGKKIKAVGFSGHHLGTAIDMAAIALGAVYIERHFTMDKHWKGTDHHASLEPCEMSALVSCSKAVSRALTYKTGEILDVEKIQRRKLKYKNNNAGQSK